MWSWCHHLFAGWCLTSVTGPSFMPAFCQHVLHVVPQPDRRLREAVLVCERAQACRAEHKRCTRKGIGTGPTCSEHAEDMSTGEKQDVAMCLAHAGHDSVCAFCYLSWRFAAGTAITE